MNPVTCSAWESTGHMGSGRCMRGEFGGQPSHGVCYLSCPKFDGPPRDRELFRAMSGFNGHQLMQVTTAAARKRVAEAPCPTCQEKRATIIKWLGVRWIGKPWPLRWRLNPAIAWVEYEPAAGCGCILKMKALTQAFRRWWHT